MKTKRKKIFDTIQMIREIRDAMYRKATIPNFDQKEFLRIKAKWSKLLKLQEKNSSHKMESE